MRVPFRKPKKVNYTKPDYFITKERFDELEIKLKRLKDFTHPQAVFEVRRLAELGDFSENVEYQLAKGRLRGINNLILKLEKAINNASIIAPNKQNNVIQTGHTVTIEYDNKQKKYQILGSSETNPEKGIISHNSPLGSALVGRRIGDVTKLKLAGRELEYKIIKIE